MRDFILFAMREDPIALGLMIFVVLALIFGPILFLLIGPTKRNHERRHRFHSELMCDYCTQRRREHGVAAYTRWPMRVLHDEPPRGTG